MKTCKDSRTKQIENVHSRDLCKHNFQNCVSRKKKLITGCFPLRLAWYSSCPPQHAWTKQPLVLAWLYLFLFVSTISCSNSIIHAYGTTSSTIHHTFTRWHQMAHGWLAERYPVGRSPEVTVTSALQLPSHASCDLLGAETFRTEGYAKRI
jgi:hypothetical protein